MTKPIVTIITPVFNSASTINDTYTSINSQTYVDWEWIVVDDNSVDGSLAILYEFSEKDDRIKVFQNSVNSGAGVSRNKAIENAKGRYIAFLDADDVWHKKKLEKQLAFMQKNDIAFSYTYYQKFDGNGDLGIVKPPGEVTYEQLIYSNVIGCLTAIFDTDKIGKRYMPIIRKRQDMGLWLNILKDVPKAYCLQENLAKYRVDTGMTQNKLSVLGYQWRFYRDVLGLSLFRTFYTFCIYAYKGYIKSRI
jgi:teichuronic acid biosynthesis glycosyltransferase TuaG